MELSKIQADLREEDFQFRLMADHPRAIAKLNQLRHDPDHCVIAAVLEELL